MFVLCLTFIEDILAINIRLSIGYICKEKILKADVLKGREVKTLKLSKISSSEIPENSYTFGSCNESNIVEHCLIEDNKDDLVVGYTIVLNPKPLIYGDKISFVCYDFKIDEGKTSIRRPINILDYPNDFFGNLSENRNFDYMDFLVTEMLRKVLYKYRNFSKEWINILKRSIILNFDLKDLSLKFFSDIEVTKRILLSLFKRLEENVNVTDLVQLTQEDIHNVYVNQIKDFFNETDKEVIKRRIRENSPSKIFHYRRLYKMVIEFDLILIHTIISNGFIINGNLYDPKSKIKDNPIKCVKCLVLFLDYEKDCNISIFFLNDRLRKVKCYAQDITSKRVISIPKYEFTSEVKYITVVSSDGESDCILNISKILPDLLEKNYNFS